MSDFSLKSYVQDHKTIHLVGIGGVSMSALAELLLHLGAKVTGSDRTESDVTDKLSKLGAHITYAHLPENVDHADLVIRTAAVHDEVFQLSYYHSSIFHETPEQNHAGIQARCLCIRHPRQNDNDFYADDDRYGVRL